MKLLKERRKQIITKSASGLTIIGGKESLAGSVSQRACVFCGSRVVLYPVTDALHLVHGTAGCAGYTWDIRGALSSDRELHRQSFSTDLNENEIINGGEKKLYFSLIHLIDKYKPKSCFVYSTCIVGIIGDDTEAVCRKVAKEKNIPVIPVHSEGFKGTKKDGYAAACLALLKLIETGVKPEKIKNGINILGDFNIAGEIWTIKEYYRKIGITVIATLTGDGRTDDIMRSKNAALNMVQCSGSMTALAKMMEEKYGIPYVRVSYFGIEDTADALYKAADFFKNKKIMEKTRDLVRIEADNAMNEIIKFRTKLEGKRAAVYVGGGFKAISLIKALRLLGMETDIVGTQTGNTADYEELADLCRPGTVILDDTNPAELVNFIKKKKIDLFIGGVKERPIAYKLGIGFCDHNHERKIPLAGFEGMINFAKEIYNTVGSPVWKFVIKQR